MKLAIALCLFVACVSAGTMQIPRLEIMPMSDLESRITNGDVAAIGQFPYQVGLSLAFGTSGAWCGGTLVSDRWIVTAAHCTDGADGVTVYLGAFNIKNDDEAGQQRVYVSKSGIFTHENYDASTITNDIALIKLPVVIAFNEYIQPAVLPKRASSYSTYAGDVVFASGWGKDSDAATAVSPILRYIETEVITNTVCNRYFLGSITGNMICITGKEGRSTCNGDSGGPLVFKDNGENLLIGATSFGIALGCEKGWPGVFTRITSYLDWIDAKTGLIN